MFAREKETVVTFRHNNITLFVSWSYNVAVFLLKKAPLTFFLRKIIACVKFFVRKVKLESTSTRNGLLTDLTGKMRMEKSKEVYSEFLNYHSDQFLFISRL